jgi:hypothetical protein
MVHILMLYGLSYCIGKALDYRTSAPPYPARPHCLRDRVSEKVAEDLEALGWVLPKYHAAVRAKGDPSHSLNALK